MASLEEIKEYYTILKDILNSGNPVMKYNKDRAHNSAVLNLMLENSTKIDMYCGQLSVLRKGFYKHIEKEDKELSDKLQDDIKESLKAFLEKESSSISIIFENFKEDYLKDLILPDEFKLGIRKGKISLYKLDDSLTLKKQMNHFSVSDSKIVRLEQDKEQHSAICTLNHQGIYDMAVKSFTTILSVAEPVTC